MSRVQPKATKHSTKKVHNFFLLYSFYTLIPSLPSLKWNEAKNISQNGNNSNNNNETKRITQNKHLFHCAPNVSITNVLNKKNHQVLLQQ